MEKPKRNSLKEARNEYFTKNFWERNCSGSSISDVFTSLSQDKPFYIPLNIFQLQKVDPKTRSSKLKLNISSFKTCLSEEALCPKSSEAFGETMPE
ncbi:hypothetical protein CDAR_309401 [Caerostris darwini]|uniref:Uncharacterized protein n=1 Tax=Caerostris darwini TaxID=1538125 RepID=A0AAV4R6W4_9ARAC|nr:hypothetical protein CDAR_309401 [Caerostris darwini]